MTLSHSLVLIGLFLVGMMLGHFLWYISYGYRLLNKIDWGHGLLNWLDASNRLLCLNYHRLQYDRPLPLPAKGPALVLCSYGSKLDPLLLVAASRRPLRFLVPREQFSRFGLGWLLRASGAIPLDPGEPTQHNLSQAVQALQAGEVVALFPQRKAMSTTAEGFGNPGVWLSEHTDTPLFPVYIQGGRGGGAPFLRALLHRSRTRLVAYPSVYCTAGNGEACQVYLQNLFDAWKPATLPGLLKQLR